MKIEIKSISSVRKEAVVNIEKDVIQSEENSALQSLASDIKIPGFRKGKVPLSFIKSRYTKELQEQIDKTLASKIYDNIVQENNWDVFSLVRFDIENTPDGNKELTCVVDLKPTFELIDYKNIKISNPEITVSDEEINQKIEQIRIHHATYNQVQRPIRKGDSVRFQYIGTFENGTKAIDLIPEIPFFAEQEDIWEDAGKEDTDFPELKVITEGIIGMEIGGEKDIEIYFPADYEVSKELQGKKIKYHIKIFEIRERILPELNDVFFKELEITDLDELKVKVLADLKDIKLRDLRFEQREDIVQKLIESATFEVPEIAVQYEYIQIMRGFVEHLTNSNIPQGLLRKKKDELQKDVKELAQDRAKVNFILEKIAIKEKIVITQEEMQKMLIQESAMLLKSPNQLIAEIKDNAERIQELQRRALYGKTLDFILLSHLNGEILNLNDEDNSEEENNLEKNNIGQEPEIESKNMSSENSATSINF